MFLERVSENTVISLFTLFTLAKALGNADAVYFR